MAATALELIQFNCMISIDLQSRPRGCCVGTLVMHAALRSQIIMTSRVGGVEKGHHLRMQERLPTGNT